MTQKIFMENTLGGLQERESNLAEEDQKEISACGAMKCFQSQQEINLLVKKAMAKELAAMEFSEEEIQQILHLEEDIPF